MRLDKYINKLNDHDPDDQKILKLLNSDQYKISKKILATRIQMGLSQQKAAVLVGMDLEKYLQIERAQDFTSNVKVYNDTLSKLKEVNAYQLELVVAANYSQMSKRKSLSRGYSNVNSAQIQWVHN